jgi:hypothetical protein
MADLANDTKQTIDPNALYIGQGICVAGDVSVPGIIVGDGTVS